MLIEVLLGILLYNLGSKYVRLVSSTLEITLLAPLEAPINVLLAVNKNVLFVAELSLSIIVLVLASNCLNVPEGVNLILPPSVAVSAIFDPPLRVIILLFAVLTSTTSYSLFAFSKTILLPGFKPSNDKSTVVPATTFAPPAPKDTLADVTVPNWNTSSPGVKLPLILPNFKNSWSSFVSVRLESVVLKCDAYIVNLASSSA